MSRPWIGVDLDGTLAHYGRGHRPGEIGEPVPRMVERVKTWLRSGQLDVKVVTARAAYDPDGVERRAIADWTERHLGVRLQATASKDYAMLELWDDRAREIVSNTGMTPREHEAEQVRQVKALQARVTELEAENLEFRREVWGLQIDIGINGGIPKAELIADLGECP